MAPPLEVVNKLIFDLDNFLHKTLGAIKFGNNIGRV